MRTFSEFGLGAIAADRPERPFPLRPGTGFDKFPVQDVDQLLYTIFAATVSHNDDFGGIQGMPYGG